MVAENRRNWDPMLPYVLLAFAKYPRPPPALHNLPPAVPCKSLKEVDRTSEQMAAFAERESPVIQMGEQLSPLHPMVKPHGRGPEAGRHFYRLHFEVFIFFCHFHIMNLK